MCRYIGIYNVIVGNYSSFKVSKFPIINNKNPENVPGLLLKIHIFFSYFRILLIKLIFLL